jgi:hypothetical protein
MENALSKAVEAMGSQAAIARCCGVTQQAVQKWMERGRLPRTEWTGETAYAVAIAAASGNKVTVADLLRR